MKKLLLKTILLLFALVAGTATSWADAVVWNINGVKTATNSGAVNTTLKTSSITPSGATGTWTAVSDGNKSSYADSNTGAQLGAKSNREFNGTITLSSTSIPSTATITNITVTAKSNGTSTLTAKVGGAAFGESKTITGTTATDYSIDGTGSGNAIVLTLSNTTASKYINITKISVTYSTAAPTTCATPTISIPAGAFVSTKNVTIACATDGASIYYTTNGDTPTTSSTAYTAPFEISATTTVKAIAVKDGLTDSEVASQTFTKETVIDGVAALNAADDGTHYVNLTNAQITYVKGSVGYLNDANAGILFYKSGLTVKTVYNGIFKAVKTVYNAMPEITSLTAVEGTTNVAAEVADPVVLTASELQTNFSNYLARQVKINRYEPVSSTKFTDDIDFYTDYQSFTWEADKEYTFIGYPYNNSGTKQFRIVSVEEYLGEPNEITGINDEYRIDLAAEEGGIYYLNLSGATATSGATVQFEVTATNIDAADYTLSGKDLLVQANGYITVRAYVNKDATYRAAEKTFTVYLLKQPTILVNATEDITFGSTFTVDDSNIEGGAITVTSANPNVATVDGLVITPKAAGSVDITVSTAADNVYVAGSESFTLNINQPAGKETAAPAVKEIFSESWSSTAGTGGNDGLWNGKIATSTVVSDQKGWAYANEGGASHCLRVGTGSKKGTATTPAFGQAGDITVTFKAAAWDGGSEQTDLALSVVGTGTLDQESVAMTKGAFNSYEVTITGATAETKLKFAGKNASDSRFFLDDVVASIKGATIKATLNASGYATYCSEYSLDFSDYATADYSAWQVTDVSGNEITFKQITGSVKGGTGILLMGTHDATVTLKSVDSSNDLRDNKLDGTLAPTYVADNEYYGLSGDKFVKVSAGTVPAGKALLPAAEVGKVKALSFRFDGADGISEIMTNGENEKMSAIYDLSGRRVVKPTKGLYIVNGKKVVK